MFVDPLKTSLPLSYQRITISCSVLLSLKGLARLQVSIFRYIAYNKKTCSFSGADLLLYNKKKNYHCIMFSYFGLNCTGHLKTCVKQLNGNIVAPNDTNAWGDNKGRWVQFDQVQGLIINEGGQIDGQGQVWWEICSNSNCK